MQLLTHLSRLLQVQNLSITENELVGSLPSSWSNLSQVSPFWELHGCWMMLERAVPA